MHEQDPILTFGLGWRSSPRGARHIIITSTQNKFSLNVSFQPCQGIISLLPTSIERKMMDREHILESCGWCACRDRYLPISALDRPYRKKPWSHSHKSAGCLLIAVLRRCEGWLGMAHAKRVLPTSRYSKKLNSTRCQDLGYIHGEKGSPNWDSGRCCDAAWM